VALACPSDFDVATLRHEIETMYSRVATAPGGEFHFHRGPEYAITRLGYDAEIARVLKPRGRAQIADIIIGEMLPESALRDIDLWTG
jgi:arsenite methyltransferase